MKIKLIITLIWFTLIALILMIGLNSCDTATISNEIRVIDGCEYIVTGNYNGNGLTHKGNCKNKIHIYR